MVGIWVSDSKHHSSLFWDSQQHLYPYVYAYAFLSVSMQTGYVCADTYTQQHPLVCMYADMKTIKQHVREAQTAGGLPSNKWGVGAQTVDTSTQLTELKVYGFKAVQVFMSQSLLCRAATSRVKGQQPPQQMHCWLPSITQVPASNDTVLHSTPSQDPKRAAGLGFVNVPRVQVEEYVVRRSIASMQHAEQAAVPVAFRLVWCP